MLNPLAQIFFKMLGPPERFGKKNSESSKMAMRVDPPESLGKKTIWIYQSELVLKSLST